MPDTGAPWNIPYVENADLVSDWPADSLLVANAVAAGLTDAMVIKQVVSTNKTDTFTTTSATSVVVTGLTATITPATTSSRVLVIAQVAMGGVAVARMGFLKVTRGGTDIYVGDTASNRTRTVFGGFWNTSNADFLFSFPIVTVDSPGVATAVTYQVETFRPSSGTVYINRSANDTDQAENARGASSITLIEVAA
jgi:hypothetical protein